MLNVDLEAIRSTLSDVPGIDKLTLTNIGGRNVFSFDGLMAAVDPLSTTDQIVTALRNAVTMRYGGKVAEIGGPPVQIATPMPVQPITPKVKPMSNPAPGSFAASLKAMMDEARAGLAQAQDAGRARVQEAVGKLAEAKTATVTVSDNMAKQIEDAASSALADLGQISNEI